MATIEIFPGDAAKTSIPRGHQALRHHYAQGLLANLGSPETFCQIFSTSIT